MKKNRRELMALMNDHELDVDQVAKMLNRRSGTVRAWMQKRTGVDIADHSLELLRYKIADFKAEASRAN